jgi:hypothetical protein
LRRCRSSDASAFEAKTHAAATCCRLDSVANDPARHINQVSLRFPVADLMARRRYHGS